MLSLGKNVLLLFLGSFVFLASCSAAPPKKMNNICSIFKEKRSWYGDAKKASKRWGSPIAINMAIIHQESRFQATAKPPRKKILWVIPGPRPSSAFGYAQAKTTTWDWYREKSGHRGADRSDFDDAIDFVSWYNHMSVKQSSISAKDPYNLYLAYHEGHGGFKRKTYRKKKWLRRVAKKVERRAKAYHSQLKSCEPRLASGSWWPF